MVTALLLLIAACGTLPSEDLDTTIDSPPHEVISGGALTLRGEPTFSIESLDFESKMWFERLWSAIENQNQYPDAYDLAGKGDLYHYGRAMNEYITPILMAFRVTGDLRLLDEVDRVAERMRDELGTKWQDANGKLITPNNGTAGLRRWLWLKDDRDESLYGRDTHEMDALMTHGMVAMFAYAFHVNRDLASPGGVDYGARADFWIDYLKNDFEQVWRIRRDMPEGYSYLRRNLSHPWVSGVRYNHYMSLLTGETGYAEEAEYLIGKLMEDQVEVDSPVGPAYVWRHGVMSHGSRRDFLQATIYVKYDLMIRGEMAIEGLSGYLGKEHMQRIANSLSQFVDDGDPKSTGKRFAASVGGDRNRGGLSFKGGWRKREPESRWAVSGLAFGAAWDATGLVDAINDDVYDLVEDDEGNPRRVQIPAAKILMIAMQ